MNPPAKLRRAIGVLALLLILLALGTVLGLARGTVAIPTLRVGSILVHRVVPFIQDSATAVERTIVLKVRLPRLLVAMLVGSGLAVSGAVMQGVFRNPMADPGVLGVSSGASLGAVCAIALGWGGWSALAVPAMAFVGAASTAFLVYVLSTSRGRTSSSTLLLSGIAVGGMATALSALVLSLAVSQFEVGRQILLWIMGGLDGRTWIHVSIAASFVLPGSLLLTLYARDMDVLTTGEEIALSLGVDVPRVRRDVLVLASLITAACVAVSGSIAFVGLIVPHLLRLILGPGHRWLLPTSFLGGAVLIVFADLIARTAIPAQELRLGVITTLLGGPFFIFLLVTRRDRLEER